MKKKLLAIFLIVCVLAITVSTASLAYFTDTQSVKNVFSAGEVKITLDEVAVTVVNNHAQLEDPERRVTGDQQIQNYGKLYPGFSIRKDPTITNIGSENAYVGAKIVITTNGAITEENKSILEKLFSDYGEYVSSAHSFSGNTYVIYLIYNQELVVENKVVLFEKFSISEQAENEDMALLRDATVKITAYAVQSVGLSDALAALKAGFPAEFEHIPDPTPTT